MNTIFILIILLLIIIFALRKLEKLNQVDYGHKWLNCLMGLNQFLCRKVHRMGDFWLDLPETGGLLIASNHQSGIDPPALIAASKRPVRFLCTSYYYDKPILNYLLKAAGCIPVYKDKDNKLALKQAIEALNKGEIIGIFPFGGIHIPADPEPRIRSGVAVLSSLTNTPIVPVRIDGIAPFSINKVLTSMTFSRSNLKLTQYSAVITKTDADIENTLAYLYSFLSNHVAQPIDEVTEIVEIAETISEIAEDSV
jgi:1-acyl-sn-glycerol-3-phosphate acyltransferase